MMLKLPSADCGIPCFKLRDTKVYLVVDATLCSFTALKIQLLRKLTKDIGSWQVASY
jgi:hypothetical protein